MNKKLFGALLACVLILSQSIAVFAAPSGTTSVTAKGDTTVEVTVDFTATVTEADAIEVINVTNTAGVTDAQIIDAVNKTGDVKIEAATATFVTKFFDVKVANKSDDGKYHAQIDVPALPANASVSNVRGLHYSVVRKVWEILTPVSVNGASVEFAMDDCSPITVFVTGTATSPKTGETNPWGLYLGAAVVLLAAAGAAAKKSRSN